jgi:imidazolonepropionase-like amidohydrolase
MGQLILCGLLLIGSDERLLKDAVVRVADGRITDIREGYGASMREDGDEVLDYRTATVMPGLIDMHDHLNGDGKYSIGDDSVRASEATWTLVTAHYARRALMNGITTVRVPGVPLHVDIALREAIAEGIAVGPRLICAGQGISMTGGHGFGHGREADGPHEIARVTREQIKAGADFIKLKASGGVGTTREGEHPTQTELSVEEMRAAANVAHAAGLPITAHADGIPAVRNCIEAGLDTIEHGIFMGKAEAEEMARRGMALIPTLAVMRGIARRGKALGLPSRWIPIAESVIEPHMASFRAALDAGVLCGAGTDGFCDLIEEIQVFAEAGLSRYRAIQAATGDAGRIIGRHRIGLIEPEYEADLIALRGNPLDDLEMFRDVALVMRAGTVWLSTQTDRAPAHRLA